MTDEEAHFVLVDYITFALAFGGSVCLGIHFALSGGRQKTTSEYQLGNRHMNILPVVLSVLISFESSIMMLGYRAEIYEYGIVFWLSVDFVFVILIPIRI